MMSGVTEPWAGRQGVREAGRPRDEKRTWLRVRDSLSQIPLCDMSEVE